MNLKNALQRAAKLVPTDKTQNTLRHLLLVSDEHGDLPKVIAGDGEVWTHITLDEGLEVIDGAIPVADLAKLLVDAKEVLAVEWGQGGGSAKITLRTKANTLAQAEVQVMPTSLYPRPHLPDDIEFTSEPFAHDLQKVAHAVGGNPMEPHLAYVHASKDGLAGSDGYRISMAQWEAPWEGLVPVKLFAHWPKREAIGLHVQRSSVAIKIGDDEIRHASFVKGPYPDAWGRAQGFERWQGPRVVVSTEAFAGAVKQASTVGPVNAVWLRMREGRIKIESVALDESKSYQAEVRGDGCQKDADILVDGKMLHQALSAFDTPTVLVGYRRSFDPLRLESGRSIECIWPMEAPTQGPPAKS